MEPCKYKQKMSYKNTHALTEHLKIISSIPALCDVTFEVGPETNFNEIGYTLKSVILNILCIPIRHLEYNQGLAAGQWFSLGTPVFSTNETDHHNIT
jgi:hypothetical protein